MPSERRPSEQPPTAAEHVPIREPRVGWLVSLAGPGQVRVDFPGNPAGPALARVAAALDAPALEAAVQQRQGAVLLFEDGDPTRPLVLALLAPTGQATPLLDALLTPAGAPEERPREARVDGRRVVIEGQDEVVLRCGKASITLTHDGKVELRGVQVVSDAEERQRIRGRTVQIN